MNRRSSRKESGLIVKADTWFSRMVRLKHSDEYGMVTCCTCEKRIYWKQSDAGHWQLRDRMGTRYDERNVHPQCKHCNRVMRGQTEAHRIYIERVYGKDVVELLKLKAKTPCKFMDDELERMVNEYKKKVKELGRP